MSNKKSKTPSKPAGRVISLDALLGNWPTIELAGISFEGREFNQREKALVGETLVSADDKAQAAALTSVLNARGADVTEEWFYDQPTAYLVAIIEGLNGNGWGVDANPK